MDPYVSPRNGVQAQLVELLANLSLMQDLDGRQQIVRLVRQQLNHQVTIRDIPEPRRQAVELASNCLPVDGGVAALIYAIGLIAPAAIELNDLRRCEQTLLVSDQDFLELEPLLAGHLPANRDLLYRRATGYLRSAPPAWCRDSWDIFIELDGLNAPPSGLPPSMMFLLLLEYEMESSLAAKIQRRNQRVAFELQVTAELDQQRTMVNQSRDQPREPCVYLLIQVAPESDPGAVADPASRPPERYTVSYYRQWYSADSLHSQLYGQIEAVPHQQLLSHAQRIIRLTEAEWTDRPGQLVVEFVLPLHLLNEDVAWWPTDSDQLPGDVLTLNYPVVVRSLDRHSQRQWHYRWQRRWEQMQADPSRGTLHRCMPDQTEEYLRRLGVQLASDHSCYGLVLSGPPSGRDGTGMDEMLHGLRAGLPMIVWHRTDQTSDRFWQEVSDMTEKRKVLQMPFSVWQRRWAALRLAEDALPGDSGRQMMLLWDDPERVPELDHRSEQDRSSA